MAKKQFKCNVCGYVHEGAAAPDTCPVCGAPASEFTELKGKKGLFGDTNSNAYIVLYSTVMVVVVATLLALAALGLQKRQAENELNEKKQAILGSLAAQGESYDEFIDAYVVDAEGRKVEDAGDIFALLNDLPGAFAAGKFPIFEARDGRVVIPVTGMGLWGPVWGYLALEKDMNSYNLYKHKQIEERAVEVANYIIENNATVRETAKKFGISKSTVHKDVTERLGRIDPLLASQARKILEINKAERHIRGGMATREKYLHLAQHSHRGDFF